MKLLEKLKEQREKIIATYNSLWDLSQKEVKKKELREAMRLLGFALNSLNELILEEEINKNGENNKTETENS